MGYVLRGLVAAAPVARAAAEKLSGVVVELGQGLALVPGPEVDPDEQVGDVEPVWWGLVVRVADEARAASELGPIAYLEADYFGGTGTQSAMVWHRGLVELGPLTQDDGAAGTTSPINAVLHHLGAGRVDGKDEFDSLRLGRHRHLEDWYPENVRDPR